MADKYMYVLNMLSSKNKGIIIIIMDTLPALTNYVGLLSISADFTIVSNFTAASTSFCRKGCCSSTSICGHSSFVTINLIIVKQI